MDKERIICIAIGDIILGGENSETVFDYNQEYQPEIISQDDPKGKEVFDYIEKISQSQGLSTGFDWEGGEVVIGI